MSSDRPRGEASLEQSFLGLQEAIGNRATRRILNAGLLQIGAHDDRFEHEADRMAEPAAPQQTPGLIVADEMAELGPDQMRKSDFLAEVRSAVCGAAEEAFVGTEHTARGCVRIEAALRFYERQRAERLERDLAGYVPEGADVTSARDYIPFIAARARRSVEVWVETGEITGLPPGLPGRGLAGGLAGSLFSGQGGMFVKASAGGPRGSAHPRAVQAQLGAGRSFSGLARGRMESAFGRSFSGVRIHDDGAAAGLASRLDARAFTVGEHVAFGLGQYRPGTLVGDALLAHELAHVAQQQEAGAAVSRPAIGRSDEARLENEADGAALAVVSPSLPTPAPTRLRELRLQRCRRRRPAIEELDPAGYPWQNRVLREMTIGALSVEDAIDALTARPRAEQEDAIEEIEQFRRRYLRSPLPRYQLTGLERVLAALYREVAQAQAPGLTAPVGGWQAGQAPRELLAGTRRPGRRRRAAIAGALTPAREDRGGECPERDFSPEEEQRYEEGIRQALLTEIRDLYDERVESLNRQRSFPMERVVEVANAARREVDAVFGSYATGPEFEADVNLYDRWQRAWLRPGATSGSEPLIAREIEQRRASSERRAGSERDQRRAREFAGYLLRSSRSIDAIHAQYRVVPDCLPASRILARVRNEIADQERSRLLEILRAWPAVTEYVGEGENRRPIVTVQRFRGRSDSEDRRLLWRMFQSVIHEYLHTLTHREYMAYAESSSSEQYQTLVEGVTSVLTEVVWSHVEPRIEDQDLRDRIEGPELAAQPLPPGTVPPLGRYGAYDQAMEVIRLVGIRNVYAAYFLGRTDLIGETAAARRARRRTARR